MEGLYNLGRVINTLIILLIIVFIRIILSRIAIWKILTKSGINGWKCLIPSYNFYVLTKMTGFSKKEIVLFFIPVINIFTMLDFYIRLYNKFNVNIKSKLIAFIFGLSILTFCKLEDSSNSL